MSEEINKIEDIKRRLYDKEDTLEERKKEHKIHSIDYKIGKDWEDKDTSVEENETTMKKPKSSFFKKFFIFAIIFFVGALGFAYYMFSTGGVSVSSDNIDINVLGNSFTKGGEDLPLQIEILNRNNANLELVNMVVSYPKGASDNTEDMTYLPRESIGTITKGESVTRNVSVRLFGEEKSIKEVKVVLEYHPEGSNAIFTKEKYFPVTISQAPITLSIEAPDEITSEQSVSIKIKATLNTELPEGATVLQVSYPNGFVFDNSTPTPIFQNSVWDLSALSLKDPVDITIKGRIMGQDGDLQAFHVYAGTVNVLDKSIVDVAYSSLIHEISITKPFLEAKILVNGKDEVSPTTSSSGKISATIHWVNNLSNKITDAEIIANISGNIFDKNSVNAMEGFYDSSNSRIVWNKNTVSELGSLEPGANGELSFTLSPLSLVGSSSIRNPEITIDISIKGRQPLLGSSYEDVNNFSKKVIKILSDFQIATSASYNSGFLPPKAENETKYNIRWTLSNTTNMINNARAVAILPVYVDWVGVSNNENVSYNSSTREVVWNIGNVEAYTGFNSTKEAIFTVSLKPSISQVGSVPQLIKEVNLSGVDNFSGQTVTNSKPALTTYLKNSSSFVSGQERVIQ